MMKKKIYLKALFVFVAATVMTMGGCRSSKAVPDRDIPKEAGGVGAVKSPAAVAETLAAGYGEWTDVAMPVKVNVLEPKYMSLSGKAVMVRGKEIYISMRVLGFEAGGIYIDADTVYVYEKLHRVMLAEPLSRLSGATGMTLGDIQDALLGRVFDAGKGTLTPSTVKNFKLQTDGGMIVMTPARGKKKIDMNFNVADAVQPALKTVSVDVGAMATLECTYPRLIETAVGFVAAGVTLDAVAGKHKVKASLDWSLSKADWNRGAVTKWKKPAGYERLDFNKILKAITGR